MKRRSKGLDLDGIPVPAELLDPDHAVWHDDARHRVYIADRGWCLPGKERMGVQSSAAQRRTHAAGEWAREAGIMTGGFPDWHRLRARGLLA